MPGRLPRSLRLLEDPTGHYGGSCGSGTVLWPAAVALIELLDQEVPKSCLNVRSLELGAGCGAVGLFLNVHKGCEVWLTERPENLPLLARNVRENAPEGLDIQDRAAIALEAIGCRTWMKIWKLSSISHGFAWLLHGFLWSFGLLEWGF